MKDIIINKLYICQLSEKIAVWRLKNKVYLKNLAQ